MKFNKGDKVNVSYACEVKQAVIVKYWSAHNTYDVRLENGDMLNAVNGCQIELYDSEREQFEKWFEVNYPHLNEESKNDVAVAQAFKQIALEAWQAPVNRADFVLVPREPTKEQVKFVVDLMRLKGGLDMIGHIYKAMIEAWEQSDES